MLVSNIWGRLSISFLEHKIWKTISFLINSFTGKWLEHCCSQPFNHLLIFFYRILCWYIQFQYFTYECCFAIIMLYFDFNFQAWVERQLWRKSVTSLRNPSRNAPLRETRKTATITLAKVLSQNLSFLTEEIVRKFQSR